MLRPKPSLADFFCIIDFCDVSVTFQCLSSSCRVKAIQYATQTAAASDKRKVMCQSPACSKVFHAACIGRSKTSDKEMSNLFFVFSRCETFLKYSADIAQKAFLGALDKKLDALRESIYQSFDERIASENKKIIQQTQTIIK